MLQVNVKAEDPALKRSVDKGAHNKPGITILNIEKPDIGSLYGQWLGSIKRRYTGTVVEEYVRICSGGWTAKRLPAVVIFPVGYATPCQY